MGLSEGFKELCQRPSKKGEVAVFRLNLSSYYPSWLERCNRDKEKEQWWYEEMKRRNLRSGINPFDIAKFEGELYVYKFDDQKSAEGMLVLAQMDLRRVFTLPGVVQYSEKNGIPVPQVDISLVSARARMPYFQQVTGMSAVTELAHVYTVDEEGSKWSHHVLQDWENHPLVK